MPDLLVALVKRLVRWGVLPAKMAPDTAIINIYDQVPPACITPCSSCSDVKLPLEQRDAASPHGCCCQGSLTGCRDSHFEHCCPVQFNP